MKAFCVTCCLAAVLYASRSSAAEERAAGIGVAQETSSSLTFEQHVRPILKAMCFQCHGEEDELRGGLDLRLVRQLITGGDTGPAIVPGLAESSLLWQRIEADEMPDAPKKLSPEQKVIIRQWIDDGAPTARPEPESVEDAIFTLEELSHWAYQPVVRPATPRPRGYKLATPVDGFIAARLAEAGFSFSPVAGRRTLIRRVYFDLTGLPPTPDEVEAFIADRSPDAYPRLIDRLLASPQFGVRWGRHWLDIAGFAESDGGEGDAKREHAWRYRDYVIAAFNESKPVSEFLCEQLAGDEMIEGPLDRLNPRHRELLIATGFLRMAPDATQTSNTLANRNLAVADSMRVISSVVLGMTVGCAQCHDHKYDPIGTDDYYRFRAIFDPVFPLQDWQRPSERLVDLTHEDVRAEAERIEAKAKLLEDDLNSRRQALGQQILERRLADVPEAVREATRTAVLAPAEKRSAEQVALLDQYPMVRPVSQILGLLIEYDMPAHRKFEKEQQRIVALRATKPPFRLVMATTERPGTVPQSAVFFRGDPETPKEPVLPAELTVLALAGADVVLPVNDPECTTTRRRLTYAHHLTGGSHPLTARVFVNRVWQHHMGRGLVATPSDFGISGDRPSHPELLDWLADDLVRYGWDQKRLHRLILLSTTYQQQALRTPQLDSVDPENWWYGRMNVRRLEAEALRDAILAVSDRLSMELGGPSVPVTENGEGKVVIGTQRIRDGLPAGVQRQDSGEFRRSAFIEVHRTMPLNVLSTFDQPAMNPNCDVRQPSTVATQSLWLLNDAAMVERAEELAELLLKETEGDVEARVKRLYLRLFAVPPTPAESRMCIEFLASLAETLRPARDEAERGTGDCSAPQNQAFAALCHTLLASNRFLYVD